MALALSAKTFNSGAPSVWNSLSLYCSSAQLASLFRRSMLKTIEPFDIAYTEHSDYSLRHHVPPIRLRHCPSYSN